MVAAKQKTATSFWAKNKAFVIIVGVFVLVAFLGFLYYQSQRPNFRDLEKEFSTLQIPADWQKVSANNVTGWLGMFCFEGIDQACPTISKSYTSSSTQRTPENDKVGLQNILESGNYTVTGKSLDNCSLISEKYYCTYTGEKSGLSISATTGIVDSKRINNIRIE